MTSDEVAKDIVDGASLWLIINWNVILSREGIQRVVRNHPEELEIERG